MNMKRGELSTETLFWLVLFIIGAGLLFFIFMQTRAETLNLMDLIPV
jgi:hypothetical protein